MINFHLRIHLLRSIHIEKHEMTPKKYALTKAIEKSKGEIILTTDADCRVPRDWVNNMAQLVQNNEGIVIGYSKNRKYEIIFK